MKTHFSGKGSNNGMYKNVDDWGFIEQSFKNGELLEGVASKLGLSKPTLSNKIKEKYGLSVRNYVKQK